VSKKKQESIPPSEAPALERPILTDIPGAARLLATTVNNIRQLVWDGKLTPIKMGSRFCFDIDDLREFAKQAKLDGGARRELSARRSRAGQQRKNPKVGTDE
jgi:excisionase family DNA binding protein